MSIKIEGDITTIVEREKTKTGEVVRVLHWAINESRISSQQIDEMIELFCREMKTITANSEAQNP